MNKRDVDKIAKKLHSLRLKESNKVIHVVILFGLQLVTKMCSAVDECICACAPVCVRARARVKRRVACVRSVRVKVQSTLAGTVHCS